MPSRNEDRKMKNVVVYVHGKGGNAGEAERYKPLFTGCEVVGFDYRSQTPWDAKREFPLYFSGLRNGFSRVFLIANSIGAYFCLHALTNGEIDRAFLLSPVVSMEKLIEKMMSRARVTEDDLREKREIQTAFGETLSWAYLKYVREHPIGTVFPSEILYGEKDEMTDFETVSDFARRTGAGLTVMKGGEHWFHTDEQMKFLDTWLKGLIR